MLKAFLKEVPVPTAGLALGIISFGKLVVGYGLGWVEPVTVALALVLTILVAGKALLCPHHLKADLAQPVQAAVFGTFFMTIMQLATYLALVSLPAAQVLWAVAVFGHFALMAVFTVLRLRDPKLTDVFATWFVCYVGIIVGSVTAPVMGFEGAGQVIFWIGFVFYLALLVLVTARHAKHEIPAAAKPTFCIYSAPMSLSLAGYLSCFAEPVIPFVLVLEVAAQALFLMVLTQLPKLVRQGFYPSFAAMTFPFVITATAFSKTLAALRAAGVAVPGILDALLLAEVVFAGVMVVFVTVCFVRHFAEKLAGARAEVAASTASVR